MRHGETFTQRRTVACDRTPVAPRTTQAPGWTPADSRPRRAHRHPLRAQKRHPLGDAAPGAGLWFGHDLLAEITRLAAGWGLAPAPPGLARPTGGSGQDRLEPRFPGFPERPCPRGGEATGPNPTDRGKSGTKRHLLVDREGVPLAVILSGAHVHDSQMLEPTLDAVEPIKRPRGRPRKRPEKLHADKAYDSASCRRACRQRGITPRIARRGIESSERLGRYRWVVERTMSWLNRCRRLKVRYERRADIHQAFLTVGCALIVWNYVQRFC
jgi:transposase